MIISTPRGEFHAFAHACISKGVGVFNYPLGIPGKIRAVGFGKRNSLGGYYMGKGPAYYKRAPLVYRFGKLLLCQNKPAPGPPKGFMGGRSYDISMGHWVIISGHYLSSYQTRKMGHIDEKNGTDLIGNFFHPFEVDETRICRITRDEDKGFHFHGHFFYFIIIKYTGIGIHTVRICIEHLGTYIKTVTMSQMSAGVIIQTHDSLITIGLANFVPLFAA